MSEPNPYIDVQHVMERMQHIMNRLSITPPQWRGNQADLMIDEWIQLKREVYGSGEMHDVQDEGSL